MTKFWYHALALFVVGVWGITFVETKVLLQAGLTPPVIFFLRFLLAYVAIVVLSLFKNRRFVFFSKTLKDELIFVALGLTGGSLYFYTENTALSYTQATNVSFLVSITPVVTCLVAVLFAALLRKKVTKFTSTFTVGSMIAIVGMFLVIFDGDRPQISLKGDLMAIGAALCWAIYGNILDNFLKGYSSLFITRKVFFYGLITNVPMLGNLLKVNWLVLLEPHVYLNLLFLGLVASLFCFVAWNKVLMEIGTIRPTNYLYLNPFFTLFTALIFLGEQVTVVSIVGSVAIVTGVAVSQLNIGRK